MMSWTRDGCMSNVAQSVGAWRTAAVAMQRRAPNDLLLCASFKHAHADPSHSRDAMTRAVLFDHGANSPSLRVTAAPRTESDRFWLWRAQFKGSKSIRPGPVCGPASWAHQRPNPSRRLDDRWTLVRIRVRTCPLSTVAESLVAQFTGSGIEV